MELIICNICLKWVKLYLVHILSYVYFVSLQCQFKGSELSVGQAWKCKNQNNDVTKFYEH